MRMNLLTALSLMLVTGCGGAEVRQVTGQVLLNGTPMPKVFVYFYPVDDLTLGTMSQSFAAEDGSFDIAPNPERGEGRAGEYCVLIGDIELKGLLLAAMMAGTMDLPPVNGRRIPPAPYWLQETTPLRATIQPGINHLEPFELAMSKEAFNECMKRIKR